MLIKKAATLLKVFVFLFLISGILGCATFRSRNLEQQALQNQVQVLEVQLKQKDAEIARLREALNSEISERQTLVERFQTAKVDAKTSRESSPSVKQIQIALKNAGYSPGTIDGKMGKKTKSAIRAFQRSNDLKVDGKVGKRTWRILKKYLYRKAK